MPSSRLSEADKFEPNSKTAFPALSAFSGFFRKARASSARSNSRSLASASILRNCARARVKTVPLPDPMGLPLRALFSFARTRSSVSVSEPVEPANGGRAAVLLRPMDASVSALASESAMTHSPTAHTRTHTNDATNVAKNNKNPNQIKKSKNP
ncbi:unnamed protein product, partial [Brenthis ino]